MLDYSEYKSLIDTLEKSELDETYKDLMKMEGSVLDTVNAVVNQVRDKKSNDKQFMHMSLYEIYNLLFLEIPLMIKEVNNAKTSGDVVRTLFKGHRVIYIGIMLVLISIILFFVNSSK
jgi:hypothetical protein